MTATLTSGALFERNVTRDLLTHSRSQVLPCPCCASDDWKAARFVRRAWLSHCSNCGLLATTEFLKGCEQTDALYNVGCENHQEYSQRYLPARSAFYSRVLPTLEPLRETGRLLEIGSGFGYFLAPASAAGWNAQGVEISGYACNVARSRGCNVQQGNLLELPLDPGSYDVVAMWDVVEHFLHPARILQRCRDLLRPGGIVILRTPDARALRGGEFFQVAYSHLAYPANTAEHVFHFTPQDLAALLARLAFERVGIAADSPWNEFVVSGSHAVIRGMRWLLLRCAFALHWPYEFLAVAAKPIIP